jgi:hypothetical protein
MSEAIQAARESAARLVRRRAPRTAQRVLAARAAVRVARLTAKTYGHYSSAWTLESVGPGGVPVPWYTYPALQWLAQLRFDDVAVLEFGSGNSSRWWASKAASLTAIEDDPEWYAKLAPTLPGNVDYRLRTDPVDYASPEGRYGVVVVDGSHRYDCAQSAVAAVQPGGMIILDNSDWHPGTARLLRDAGFVQIDFIGPGPINPYPWATSAFMAPGDFMFAHVDELQVPGGVQQRSGSDRPAVAR